MPRRNRLIRNSDFENVKRWGVCKKGNFFFLSFLKNNLSFSRFGVVVSKKVSKNAVDRNRIKRIVRNFLIEAEPSIAKGFDFVVIVRNMIVGKEDKVIKELRALFGGLKDEKNSNISD